MLLPVRASAAGSDVGGWLALEYPGLGDAARREAGVAAPWAELEVSAQIFFDEAAESFNRGNTIAPPETKRGKPFARGNLTNARSLPTLGI